MIKLVFMGTPNFAVPFLKKLAYSQNIEITKVITQPDRPVGRKKILNEPPIKSVAKELRLTVEQPGNSKELYEVLKNLDVDFFVVVAYGMILKKEVLNIPKIAPINVHGSLLPKYRGASPVHQSLINGDKTTGISIMKMEEGLDSGPVYLLKRINIEESDDIESLQNKLSKIGADILPMALDDIKSGILTEIKQDDQKATHCKKIEKEDGEIKFTETAEEIFKKFKAFKEWPGLFYIENKRRIKLLEIENQFIEKDQMNKLFNRDKKLYLSLKDKAIEIKKIQLEGKNPLSAEEFIAGFLK